MEIKPTILIVKQHNKTGLKYFHKTTRLDLIESYLGSGRYWKRHLNKHGNDCTTLWKSEVFTNKDDLVEFALFFSEFYNIVESKEWANEKPENGLDGGAGKHMFGGKMQGLTSRKRVEQGTHNFIGENGPTRTKLRNGTHHFQNDEWQKENNPWIVNNPSKTKYKCKVTGIISHKGGFARRAKNKGLQAWPHELEQINKGSNYEVFA